MHSGYIGSADVKAKLIEIRSEACNGCLRCQMVCSLTYGGSINPEAAYIQVEREPEYFYRYRVSFKEGCHSGCRLCAKHCPYGCLVVKEGEVE